MQWKAVFSPLRQSLKKILLWNGFSLPEASWKFSMPYKINIVWAFFIPLVLSSSKWYYVCCGIENPAPPFLQTLLYSEQILIKEVFIPCVRRNNTSSFNIRVLSSQQLALISSRFDSIKTFEKRPMWTQANKNFFIIIILVSGLCVMVALLKYSFGIKSHVKMSKNHYKLIRKAKNNQQNIWSFHISFSMWAC